MIIGENSYVTIEEANEYLQYEIGFERWTSLTDKEKEAYLVTAYREIQCFRLTNVPEDTLKEVQILEAFGLSDSSAYSAKAYFSKGITRIQVGNASESYGDGAGASVSANIRNRGLISDRAYCLLNKYLTKSACIVGINRFKGGCIC